MAASTPGVKESGVLFIFKLGKGLSLGYDLYMTTSAGNVLQAKGLSKDNVDGVVWG